MFCYSGFRKKIWPDQRHLWCATWTTCFTNVECPMNSILIRTLHDNGFNLSLGERSRRHILGKDVLIICFRKYSIGDLINEREGWHFIITRISRFLNHHSEKFAFMKKNVDETSRFLSLKSSPRLQWSCYCIYKKMELRFYEIQNYSKFFKILNLKIY